MRARAFHVMVWVALVAGCTGGGSSPTGPSASTSSNPTRIINVTGNLAFGDVSVGSSRDSAITISNTGNSPLNVQSLSVSGGLAAHTTASFTNGVIAAGASQSSTIRFQPTAAGAFTGTITVNADHTAGSNTVGISGNALQPDSAAGSWSGNYIIERCDGTGSTQDLFCSASRGIYPVGSSLPIRMTLTQSGGGVTGTLSLGQVSGSVNGSISSGGDLILSGSIAASGTGGRLTAWTTRVVGNQMSGNFNFDATFTGTPGVAAIRARLGTVTK